MNENTIKIKPKKPKKPQIYAYIDSDYPTYIKIGYTSRCNHIGCDDADRLDVMDRINEQKGINKPSESKKQLIFYGLAMRKNGTAFTDKDIHKVLRRNGFKQQRNENGNYTEFFECDLNDVVKAYKSVLNETDFELERINDFKMRPEQEEAVNKTCDYFISEIAENRVPHFLWNCKMRFGKTFATYKLMKEINAKKVLILTFKPAVEEQWKEDLLTHVDFSEYQFSSKKYKPLEEIDLTKPFVCFGSLQDYLGKDKMGNIKETNTIVFNTTWDLIVLDEFHYGAWNDRTQDTVDTKTLSELDYSEQLKEQGEGSISEKDWNENTLKSASYLYLSGTPFKALANGTFTEEQIYNWTYSDEQRCKEEYIKRGKITLKDNPYLSLPKMNFFTYKLPNSITEIVEETGKDTFSLNEFFKATGKGKDAKFAYESGVQKFLDILRNKELIKETPTSESPYLPFDNVELRNLCHHQMWFLPNVSSCDAMENLLKQKQNAFYEQERTIINCSGTKAGVGLDALNKTIEKLELNPYTSKKGSIILTCGKLTTGVTLKFLSGILMLSNCSSPETYFQTAFRVQSPWVIKNENGESEILKEDCFVFDFAPTRVLTMMVDYACELEPDPTKTSVKKVEEFIDFLPVLQYDGYSFNRPRAEEIVEFVDNGITSTLLAKKWSSNDLFDISLDVLKMIEEDSELLRVFDKIQGWRRVENGKIDDLALIIQKSEKIKETKKKGDNVTKEEKKEVEEEKKKVITLKKKILEKLKQFIKRIPLFMYLSDYREQTLEDVITKLEPELFEEVTNLTVDDFKLLKEKTPLFNGAKINNAILKFKAFEDKSIKYLGINKYENERNVGLFDTTISKEDFIIALKK